MKKRIAILASGGGSNAEALLKAMQDPAYPAQCVLVFSNKPGAGVLEKAQTFGVPIKVLDHKSFVDRESYDREVIDLLRSYEPDFICLAGYLRILTPAFTQAFAGKIMNIHPALLPKHGGPGMHGHHVHEAVLAAGEKESGASVHWVTEVVDGGAVIDQERVPVLAGDDIQALAARVLTAEHQVYARALKTACLAG